MRIINFNINIYILQLETNHPCIYVSELGNEFCFQNQIYISRTYTERDVKLCKPRLRSHPKLREFEWLEYSARRHDSRNSTRFSANGKSA